MFTFYVASICIRNEKTKTKTPKTKEKRENGQAIDNRHLKKRYRNQEQNEMNVPVEKVS